MLHLGWRQLIHPDWKVFLTAGTRSLADMWIEATRSSMPVAHSRQNAELPALGFNHKASASYLPLPAPNVSTYTHMRSNANSTIRMPEDAAWQTSTLAHLHHERSSQLGPAREDILERQHIYFSTNSQSPRTLQTDSPMSAFTAHGSHGSESPSMPANTSGGNAYFERHSSDAAAPSLLMSQTPTKQGPGTFTRIVLCSVPSGLSRDSTTPQVEKRDGSPQRSPTSNMTADHQHCIPIQVQIDNYLTSSASLVSGSSRKRKAQVEKTPESIQDLMDTDIFNNFHIRGVPASALLPDLGMPDMQSQSMQPLQQVSAVEQMQCAPSQPNAGSAIDDSTDEVPPFKRQRLSRSSGSWGSSSSAQLLNSSYLVPTPGQECDPYGVEEAKTHACSNSHYASSATPRLYYMGQVPVPMQISPGPVMTPQAHFQPDPDAGPQMTPQLPSQSALQEASMAPPQVPSQIHPPAPASNKRAVFQAGQTVWGRWYKGWWPAMVIAAVPPDQCADAFKGIVTASSKQCFHVLQCASRCLL